MLSTTTTMPSPLSVPLKLAWALLSSITMPIGAQSSARWQAASQELGKFENRLQSQTTLLVDFFGAKGGSTDLRSAKFAYILVALTSISLTSALSTERRVAPMPSQVNAAISLLRTTIHAHGTLSNINHYLRFYYYAVVEVWIGLSKRRASACLALPTGE